MDKKKLNYIIKYYGSDIQIQKAVCSLMELESELKMYIYHKKIERIKKIIDKMADTYVILDQLKIIFKNEDEIDKIIDFKIDKLIEEVEKNKKLFK